MYMIETFAYATCIILAALTLFQLALIGGAPLGRYAWGGTHRVLPLKLRIGSLVSIILYGIFAIVILNKASISSVISNNAIVSASIWVLTTYFFIGVVMNGISRSKSERAVMTPIALALAVLCLLIAIN